MRDLKIVGPDLSLFWRQCTALGRRRRHQRTLAKCAASLTSSRAQHFFPLPCALAGLHQTVKNFVLKLRHEFQQRHGRPRQGRGRAQAAHEGRAMLVLLLSASSLARALPVCPSVCRPSGVRHSGFDVQGGDPRALASLHPPHLHMQQSVETRDPRSTMRASGGMARWLMMRLFSSVCRSRGEEADRRADARRHPPRDRRLVKPDAQVMATCGESSRRQIQCLARYTGPCSSLSPSSSGGCLRSRSLLLPRMRDARVVLSRAPFCRSHTDNAHQFEIVLRRSRHACSIESARYRSIASSSACT